MDFKKYKFIYLIGITILCCAYFIMHGAPYEAIVDLSLTPPEAARKTDFSWITVNEWFVSQCLLITSYDTLKDVKSTLDTTQIKKVLGAKRIGAADAIRVYARVKGNARQYLELVGEVANIYLSKNYPVETKKETDVTKDEEASIVEKTASLKTRLAKIEKETAAATGALRSDSDELKKANAASDKLHNLAGQADSIDQQIRQLNANISKLKEVYTDNWPEVISLKNKVSALQAYKASLNFKPGDVDAADSERSKWASKVASNEQYINTLQGEKKNTSDEIQLLNSKIIRYNEEVVCEKKLAQQPANFIINPPMINYLPDLGPEIVYGVIAALIIWASAGVIVTILFRKP